MVELNTQNVVSVIHSNVHKHAGNAKPFRYAFAKLK